MRLTESDRSVRTGSVLITLLLVACASGRPEGGAASEAASTSVEPTLQDHERPAESLSQPGTDEVEEAAPLARALVKLIVLGDFREELLDEVEAGLRRELDVDVERIVDVPLPRSAYYPPRRRYRADRLLEFLNDHLSGEPATTRVIGLTAVDISTTKPPHRDWGVFGLGELGGRSCIVSSFRLSERGRRSDALVTTRVVTTAVHEVGHTLGLEHCNDPGGVMRDAEGSIRTVDTSDGHLGPICRARIERTAPRILPYRTLE